MRNFWHRGSGLGVIATRGHGSDPASSRPGSSVTCTWIRPRQAGLGHNRLSIIDLSPAGHQPMPNHDGTRWIVFNGEIYNYLELRAELSDYPYRSQTDTEVVLAAYERWGEKCLDHLLGMFAFSIWDSRAQRLFVARDRFGVKPLYYHRSADGTLWLASEIKALHSAGVPRSLTRSVGHIPYLWPLRPFRADFLEWGLAPYPPVTP